MTANIQITERDIDILKFINEFGFCEIRHIQKEFNLKKRNCYAVMKRLVLANLVEHKRVYHQQHGVYCLTTKGASYTDLPRLNTIPHSHYHHHLIVIDIYQQLKQQYPEMIWISERRLIREKFAKGLGKKGHIADGMVLLENKQIAIEAELTLKGKTRIEGILKGYAKKFEIQEVWYYCQLKTLNALKELTVKMPFVKTFLLTYS